MCGCEVAQLVCTCIADEKLRRRSISPFCGDGFRERGPRTAPREPLTSAREGRLEVFENPKKSGLSSPPPFGARLQLGASNQQVWAAFCPDTRGEARRRRQAQSAHAIEAERGARRPRWRPPEAARDLRPHGVLRRRLVAGEVCRLQALPRVTALLTALLLAPQAGWPCQHAVLALPRSRRLDGSFAGRQESGQSAASPLHCVLTLTRRAHTWRTRSSTCRAATAPTSSPPEAQARSHTSSVRRASLSVPQQEGALGYRPCLHWRGPRSTTSTRSVSARQAGRRVPRQYIRSDVQCPVRACSSV